MNEPLKKKDMVRGVIVNADEYKSDDVISPTKIAEVWVNTENLKSAVEWLKFNIECNDYLEKEDLEYVFEKIDQAFQDLKGDENE